MPSCYIYHFHLTPALNTFSFFDIGKGKSYLEGLKGIASAKFNLFTKLHKNPEHVISCYFSGTFLNALSQKKDQLNLIAQLVEKGQIELIGGTFYHSFSSLFSAELFNMEIKNHSDKLDELFGRRPKGFINTVGAFSNDLVEPLNHLGYDFTIVPKVKWFQGSNENSWVFRAKTSDMKLLLMDCQHSKTDRASQVIYTDRFENIQQNGCPKLSCSSYIRQSQETPIYNLPNLVALDPSGNDLTHFFGNSLQKQVFKTISDLAPKIIQSEDSEIMEIFLSLSSPFHFMKIDQSSRHEHRYHHYIWLINCLTDLEMKLNE